MFLKILKTIPYIIVLAALEWLFLGLKQLISTISQWALLGIIFYSLAFLGFIVQTIEKYIQREKIKRNKTNLLCEEIMNQKMNFTCIRNIKLIMGEWYNSMK